MNDFVADISACLFVELFQFLDSPIQALELVDLVPTVLLPPEHAVQDD
jgi:hypothetical protein